MRILDDVARAAIGRHVELQAQRDALRDAMARLLAAFPELKRGHATQEQQNALRNAVATLAEAGR
jgi:hypothetical protein